MIRFLVSGEGGSDVGVTTDAPGPLVSAIRHVVEINVGEELEYAIVSRKDLQEKARPKNGHDRKKLRLRGARQENGKVVYMRAKAKALALLAGDEPERGAILFSDCDYTHGEVSPSMTKKFFLDLVRAMEAGFHDANEFRYGVPMVPRPRSESWFLCHYQRDPYTKTYEDLPANDSSGGDGKHLLARFFNCNATVPEIYSHINPDEVNWGRINASSFLFFITRLQNVAERLAHRATMVLEKETYIDYIAGHQLI